MVKAKTVEEETNVVNTESSVENQSVEGGSEIVTHQVITTGVAGIENFSLTDLGFNADEIAELSGLESIDSSEITIPYATLIQKDSRDTKKGDILFPDGTVLKGLRENEVLKDIAILKLQPVRIYFPTPFSPNNTFVCRSLDGKTGAVDGVSQYPGQACDTCAFSQYPDGGGASPCRDQRLLLCAKPDGSLFHLQIGGVGMKVWKKFMSAQIMHLLPKIKRQLGGEVMGAIRVDLGVEEVDTDYGIFSVIDFNVNKEKPIHDMKHLSDILNSYKAYKMFETENIKSAATQAKFQMATDQSEANGDTGENKEMF